MAQRKLGDIEVVRAGTPEPVDTSTAELIRNLGAIGGQAIKTHQKKKLEQEFQETAEVSSAVSELQASGATFGDTGEPDFAGIDDPEKRKAAQTQLDNIRAKAEKKFKRIAQGVAQGAKTEQSAALESEATVKQLVAQTPGFGQEIRAAARDLAGFDPTGFALQQILDIPKAGGSKRLTATEQMLEQAEAIHTGLSAIGQDVSVPTIMGNIATEQLKTTQNSALDAQFSLNSMNATQWAQARFVERGPAITDMMLDVANLGASGGIVSPQQVTEVIRQRMEGEKAEFRREVANRKGVPVGTVNQIEAQIEGGYTNLLKSVKENGFGELMTTKLNSMAKINQYWGAQALPTMTRLNDAFGPQITGQIMDMMSNIADPAQFELLYRFEPTLKALIDTGGITQQRAAERITEVTEKIINGQQLDGDDLQFRGMAEQMLMQPSAVDARHEAIKSMGITSPVRAVSLLATSVPRVSANKDEVKFMKEQFNLNVNRASGQGLTPTLIEMTADSLITEDQLNQLNINSQGKLVTRQSPSIVTPGAPGLSYQTPEMKKLQSFINAVNNGWANDFGVDRNTFAQSLVERIKASTPLEDEEETEDTGRGEQE